MPTATVNVRIRAAATVGVARMFSLFLVTVGAEKPIDHRSIPQRCVRLEHRIQIILQE